MKRPDLTDLAATLEYIEYLEGCKDGSTELTNALNLMNSVYAKEFREKAKHGALLTKPDVFDMYIKFVAQYAKLKEISPTLEKDIPKEENPEQKGSIFEITQQKLKKEGKI